MVWKVTTQAKKARLRQVGSLSNSVIVEATIASRYSSASIA